MISIFDNPEIEHFYTKEYAESLYKAEILKYSISPDGIPMLTFEIEYPRFFHSELMTHRALSKNAASSRAIPVQKMIEQLQTRPAVPLYWGAKQSGMQAKEEVGPDDRIAVIADWYEAGFRAVEIANRISPYVHKQTVNRLLEPFALMKVVVSATDWENFFWLRDHPDAQPEFRHLANLMRQAKDAAEPRLLQCGQWHLPYVHDEIDADNQTFFDEDGNVIDLEQAQRLSVSQCAQVSYRKTDTSAEKADDIFAKLVDSEPVHASPTEHQATPMQVLNMDLLIDALSDRQDSEEPLHAKHFLDLGITALTFDENNFIPMSGNLRGWSQYRQQIKNNVKRG